MTYDIIKSPENRVSQFPRKTTRGIKLTPSPSCLRVKNHKLNRQAETHCEENFCETYFLQLRTSKLRNFAEFFFVIRLSEEKFAEYIFVIGFYEFSNLIFFSVPFLILMVPVNKKSIF